MMFSFIVKFIKTKTNKTNQNPFLLQGHSATASKFIV